MESLVTSGTRRVVVLTGAGVSVPSGLRPFRGPGGLWTEDDGSFELVHHVAGLPETLPALWGFWGPLRPVVVAAPPSRAHRAIAGLEGTGVQVTVLTQNVDGLHQRAGSTDVLELHGSILRTRCSEVTCSHPVVDDLEDPGGVPACPRCRGPMRPNVVLFGEMLPRQVLLKAEAALTSCDLFVAVGTSGTVWPASELVSVAKRAGARTVLVNLEPLEDPNPDYDEVHLGSAEDLLPPLLGQ